MAVSPNRLAWWTDSQLFAAALGAPLITYSFSLQLLKLGSHPSAMVVGEITGATVFALLGSTFLFNLGVALVFGVLMLVRDQGRWRWVSLAVTLQLVALLIAITETVSFGYFAQTCDSLDWQLLKHMLTTPSDLSTLLAGEVSVWQWIQIVLAVGLGGAGPWLLRIWSRRWKRQPYAGVERRSIMHAVWGVALSVPVAALGLLPPIVPVRDIANVEHPVLRVLRSLFAPETPFNPSLDEAMAKDRFFFPSSLNIARAETTPPKNLVIVLLESTRASATTPYPPHLPTTPFLDEIAKHALLIDHAYAVIPATAKAITATLCSLYPSMLLDARALNVGLLGRCLPQLLREQGYHTLYMQTAYERFDSRVEAVKAMGFETFIKSGQLPTKGFQQVNFLGYEDESMLGPSEEWLKAHASTPIFATYLTVNAHHDYGKLERHGFVEFTGGDELFNRYLNDIRATDFFLKELFDQYKRLGLYDNTIFVILGDHGEGFGEHGRKTHVTVPYEEGLHIPMIFFDPQEKIFKPGRLAGPVSQLDVMPTLLPRLGFKVTSGTMHGMSIFSSPADRVLITACFGDCAARITARQAYVFLNERTPDQLYDLQADPGETRDLAAERPQEVASQRKELSDFLKRVSEFYYLHTLRVSRPP